MSHELQTVEFAPVSISVVGKTANDKKLSVVQAGISYAAAAYLANTKGKVGQAVRDTMSLNGEFMIAKAAVDGNYKPLAQAIAVVLGQNVTITSRKDYEAMRWGMEHALSNLRNDGYSANGKASAARTSLMRVIALLTDVQRQAESIVRQREAQRANQGLPAPVESEAEVIEHAE